MSEGPYQVLLFESVSATLLAEKILKKRGVPHKLIPIPRYLSSDCGVCIRIRESVLQQAMESLEGRVRVSATHTLSQTWELLNCEDGVVSRQIKIQPGALSSGTWRHFVIF